MQHIYIMKENLSHQKRISLFRRFGIITKLTDNKTWELMFPYGVIVVGNTPTSVWLFDTRDDTLIGVIDNYNNLDGGTIHLL